MEIKKLTTVDIKNLTREELDAAYENLLRVSEMKTELIKSMAAGTVKLVPAKGMF